MALREQVRVKQGRKPAPSTAIIDSQSVKTNQQEEAHGYDDGKKVKGRKQHLLVDTVGLILQVQGSGLRGSKDAVNGAGLWSEHSLGYLPGISSAKIMRSFLIVRRLGSCSL